MLGDDMWIYLPDTSRPSASRPWNASPATHRMAMLPHQLPTDYTPVYVRTEKTGTDDCYVLNLTARRKGATYQRILLLVRVQDDRPVKADSI